VLSVNWPGGVNSTAIRTCMFSGWDTGYVASMHMWRQALAPSSIAQLAASPPPSLWGSALTVLSNVNSIPSGQRHAITLVMPFTLAQLSVQAKALVYM